MMPTPTPLPPLTSAEIEVINGIIWSNWWAWLRPGLGALVFVWFGAWLFDKFSFVRRARL